MSKRLVVGTLAATLFVTASDSPVRQPDIGRLVEAYHTSITRITDVADHLLDHYRSSREGIYFRAEGEHAVAEIGNYLAHYKGQNDGSGSLELLDKRCAGTLGACDLIAILLRHGTVVQVVQGRVNSDSAGSSTFLEMASGVQIFTEREVRRPFQFVSESLERSAREALYGGRGIRTHQYRIQQP